jgi:tetratricopeptide (TPR) repeat protein
MPMPLYGSIMRKEELVSMPGKSGSSMAALTLRSASLFVILYQFCLLAADLADTPVFVAALVFAFAAAWILAAKKTWAVPALLVIALIPWISRAAIALPRLFISPAVFSRNIGVAARLDSLLLNLDRNTFVSLLPFYWAGVTTYFSARSRLFLRGDIIAGNVLLIVTFSIVRTADMAAYRWPVLMLAVFAGILFLQILAFMLSMPPEYLLRRREVIPGAVALFLLVILGGMLLIRPSQEGAVDKGGGLLEPNLFRFDFSQVLRLESEISMSDELVFIVRKNAEDDHIFLRRYVLSGYNPKQGFYRNERIDEAAQPQRLPNRHIRLETEAVRDYRITDQEYFLVNFDSSALIAMNQPVEIVPFENWDASSFSAAYGVQSHASEALPFELMDAVTSSVASIQESGSAEEVLGLSKEEYKYYTEYGGNQRIAEYARQITYGLTNYFEMIQAVYDTLKYGEYRYSLKPGIAPDGDQLGHFLFETRKGYCSYYAFAMTLLLRSLGIPARVAAGFFIDPGTNTFNYYPVRSDMAHAWVEVRYPEYGWIEYDPTTENLAENEEFRFSSGVPRDLFERLMKEILENRSRLIPQEGEEEAPVSSLASLGSRTVRFFRDHWLLLILALLVVIFLITRNGALIQSGLSRSPRKKAGQLWAHVKRRLGLGGYKRESRSAHREGEAEWAAALDGSFPGLYALYQEVAAARYAPQYSADDWRSMKELYYGFSAEYRKRVSLRRRFLAWLLPPLALVLPPAGRRPPGPGVPAALLIIVLLLSPAGNIVKAQIDESGGSDALFDSAVNAQQAEYWERAIELYAQGMERYPRDPRFPLALGQLYYGRQLYGLAWDAYRHAEALLPVDPYILYQLSRIAGFLNKDTVSAEYLERLLAVNPDNHEAIGNLGWMYYKLHRLQEGERLLLAAMERFGPDTDFAMTLGTLYSEMFRYDTAKSWYLRAIEGGEDLGDRLFTAVAHYNLSILETRFYHFAEAFERTNASLASQNRSSGWLARGELYLRQLDLSRAFGDYQAAYETDTSSLSKINLSQAYQIAGRLEEARLYAEDCLSSRDLSWMINYGIDPIRYRRDIHEILMYTYSGLADTEKLTPYGTFGDRFRSMVREQYYRFKSAVHQHLFRKYSLLSADAYEADSLDGGEQQLDALIQYYNAFEAYPHRALAYLNKAREFEVALIPQSAYSYNTEEGSLVKNRALLRNVIDSFDPVWERDMIADTYADLARLASGHRRRAERRDAAERLYALNRGALRQNGIFLPVELIVNVNGENLPASAARIEQTLRKALPEIGMELPAATDHIPRFRLTITVADRTTRCSLYDGGRGVVIWERAIPLPSLSAKETTAFIRVLGETAFTLR